MYKKLRFFNKKKVLNINKDNDQVRKTKYKKKMTINDFETIRPLGRGAFGTVMLV